MTPVYAAYITSTVLYEARASGETFSDICKELRAKGFRRVILEGFRDGRALERDLILSHRNHCVMAELEAWGALRPTWGGSAGKPAYGAESRAPLFCLSASETADTLCNEAARLAELFNTLVIDDTLLTSCRCAVCDGNRGKRNWGRYRRELTTHTLAEMAKAARRVNDRVKVLIKAPPFYDRRARFGCDLAGWARIADGLLTGTETRNPESQNYGHVEPYQGYFNLRLLAATVGDSAAGGWFDGLDCNEQVFYEQGLTSHLGDPRQITVAVHGPGFVSSSRMARLSGARKALDELQAVAREPRGVHVAVPEGSDGDGDLFIFDYLGMLGIPLAPAPSLDRNARNLILTAHGAGDPAVVERAPAILEQGGQIIATFAALERLKDDPGKLELFGYDPAGVYRAPGRADGFSVGQETRAKAAPFWLAGDLRPKDAETLVTGFVTGYGGRLHEAPVVTCKQHNGGRALVWNLGGFRHDEFLLCDPFRVPVRPSLAALPKPLPDVLRNQTLAPLGFRLSAPPRVSTYLFAEHVVFVNYTAAPADVEVSGLPWDPDSLLSDSPRTACSLKQCLMGPTCYAALRLT